MHLHVFLTKERLIEQFSLLLQSSLSGKLWPIRACPLQSTKPLIGVHCKGPCLLWLLLLLGSLLGNAPAKRNGTEDFMCVCLLVLISGFWEPELCNKSLFCSPTVPGTVPKTHLLTKSPPLPREGKKKAE